MTRESIFITMINILFAIHKLLWGESKVQVFLSS